jgi:hypothetical protein
MPPLRIQNTFSVISALGSPGPVRAPPLGVGGWCWRGHRLHIGWCYWDYPVVPISLCHWLGLLAHIPTMVLAFATRRSHDDASPLPIRAPRASSALEGSMREDWRGRAVHSARPCIGGDKAGKLTPHQALNTPLVAIQI